MGKRFYPISRTAEIAQSENPCSFNRNRIFSEVTANQPPVDSFDNLASLISEVALKPLIKLLRTVLNKLNIFKLLFP